jgi:predicted SpoU family rRNA methylase
MDSLNITEAYIQQLEDFLNTNLRISLSKFENLKAYNNLLIVQSAIENSIKLSIYPIKKGKVIKISLYGLKLSKKILKEISKILQKFQVIHTSGFLKIKNRIYFECYLNLSISESKNKSLNASLNKIKNIFKEIKIEEVRFKNSKDAQL